MTTPQTPIQTQHLYVHDSIGQGRVQIARWPDITDAVKEVYNRCRVRPYTVIVAVGRGGYVPAVMLAHLMKLSHIYTTDSELPTRNYEETPALVVDDVYDTGHTWRLLQHEMEVPFDFAALYDKYPNEERERPEYIGYNLAHYHWIRFPWEITSSD